MRYLGPTSHPRLNEAVAVVFLATGLFVLFSLVSYHPFDPSWDTVAIEAQPVNLTGHVGAFVSDILLQMLGLGAYAVPVLILLLSWKWIRSSEIKAPLAKALGSVMLVASTCAALGLGPEWRPIAGVISAGGLIGTLLADDLIASMNLTGAALVTSACWIVALYLVSTFEMSRLRRWFRVPEAWGRSIARRWNKWREAHARRAVGPVARPAAARPADPPVLQHPEELPVEDIPIRTLDFALPAPEPIELPPVPAPVLHERFAQEPQRKERAEFRLPPTELLQEPAGRSAYDGQELKEIAARIKSKFEEFNVLGSVVQINPGPVVTTFEFKPEAGVKYSRITTLTEDLCLGLHAESILIERIPGKPTVGIEVPNSKREVISLRQILESEEFHGSGSALTVALGKDISGRIKVAALDSMPHLLIAGSTGSGKSVMLNSLIMSILYKANVWNSASMKVSRICSRP
jgi:S-DNA-T family DNA segregation ATPase FtsK/SpoIIIE